MTPDKEVTTIVARHINPGYEKQFENWMHRISAAVAKEPGFRGITVITPTKEENVRYVVYKFSDKKLLDNWERSDTKKKFITELKEYATQHYERATGLETWFTLHEHRLNAPPKWKMALSAFSGVFIISVIARLLFTRFTNNWNFYVTIAFYSAITVSALTWFYMPQLTKLLKHWLYPEK
jgi:uncharacterized protein